jgi:hypothetical protein
MRRASAKLNKYDFIIFFVSALNLPLAVEAGANSLPGTAAACSSFLVFGSLYI